MIVTWDAGARVRQPLTGELPALDQVLAALEEESTHLRVDTGEQIRQQQAMADAEARNYEMAIGQTGAATPSMQLDAVMAAKMQFTQIEQKILAVRATMEAISGIDGTKVLLLATKRLGAYAGAEFFGGSVPPNYRKELDTTKLRALLTSAANAKGVTIYPVYFEGLLLGSSTGAATLTPGMAAAPASLDNNVLMNETVALQEIAEETGGLASWGSKEIAAVLPRVSEELEAYYSLGYSASSTGRDAARRIVVTTKNPAYVVRSRRQFVEMSDAARMKDRVAANLFAAIEGSTIRFDVGMEPIKEAGKDRWTTTLKIHVPIASLLTLKEGKGEAGSFSVFVTTGSAAGGFSPVEQRTQAFNIAAADLERAKTSHYTYDFVLQLDKVVDRASVGVMDETSKEFGLKRIRIPAR
jgi:VWFA-related protein